MLPLQKSRDDVFNLRNKDRAMVAMCLIENLDKAEENEAYRLY
jgi:hypothetical protein